MSSEHKQEQGSIQAEAKILQRNFSVQDVIDALRNNNIVRGDDSKTVSENVQHIIQAVRQILDEDRKEMLETLSGKKYDDYVALAAIGKEAANQGNKDFAEEIEKLVHHLSGGGKIEDDDLENLLSGNFFMMNMPGDISDFIEEEELCIEGILPGEILNAKLTKKLLAEPKTKPVLEVVDEPENLKAELTKEDLIFLDDIENIGKEEAIVEEEPTDVVVESSDPEPIESANVVEEKIFADVNDYLSVVQILSQEEMWYEFDGEKYLSIDNLVAMISGPRTDNVQKPYFKVKFLNDWKLKYVVSNLSKDEPGRSIGESGKGRTIFYSEKEVLDILEAVLNEQQTFKIKNYEIEKWPHTWDTSLESKKK